MERDADGTFFVANTGADRSAAVAAAVRGLGVLAQPITASTDELRPQVRQPRLGLFDTFGGTMPTGWDHWTLLQFAFPVQQVWGDRIAQGDLRKDYDALVFHTGIPGARDLDRAAREIGRAHV